MTKEQLTLIKDIYSLLTPSNFVHAVYITPAEQLRRSADEIERKERLISQLGKEIHFWETGEYPKEPEIITLSGNLTDFTGTDGTVMIKQ